MSTASRSPPQERRSQLPAPANVPIVGYPTAAEGYEKHEKIGFNCWRCSVKGTDANVAIKMHNVDPALDKEKIKSEAAILRALSLQHPGLIKSHATFFNENVLWVVADLQSWMEGNARDLMSIASPGGLEETLIRAICAQVLAPLEILHKSGRLYRDLKAKNLMLLESGEVQLQTFTLPSILQEKAPMYRDSLYWVAPEILPNMDNKSASPAADIWALGVTILELALGQPPLASQDLTPQQILSSIAEGPAPSLSPEQKTKFSKAFLDVIDICLQKVPSKRATIEQLKEHSWFKNAPNCDFVVESLLFKLPEFHERVKIFLQNAATIAAKEMRAPQDQPSVGIPTHPVTSPPQVTHSALAQAPIVAKVASPPSSHMGSPSASPAPAPSSQSPAMLTTSGSIAVPVVTVAPTAVAPSAVAHPQPQHSQVHSLVQPSPTTPAIAAQISGPAPSASSATPVQTPPAGASIATSPPALLAPISKAASSDASTLIVGTASPSTNGLTADQSLKPSAPSASPSRGRQRLSGGRSHRRKRSETDDLMDQIQQVALEVSDGSDNELDELEDIYEDSDESEDESQGSFVEDILPNGINLASSAPRATPVVPVASVLSSSGPSYDVSGLVVAASPGAISSIVPGSAPRDGNLVLPGNSTVPAATVHVPLVLGGVPASSTLPAAQPNLPQPVATSIASVPTNKPVPVVGSASVANPTVPAAAVSPPQASQTINTMPRVPTSMTTAGLSQAFALPPAAISILQPSSATPVTSPADSPLESPTSESTDSPWPGAVLPSAVGGPLLSTAAATPPLATNAPGGEVRGRFRIVNNAPGSTNPMVTNPLTNVAEAAATGPSGDATPPLPTPARTAVVAPVTMNTTTTTLPVAVPVVTNSYEMFDSLPIQPTASVVVSEIHQRPLHNIPLDTYVGETEREFLIFIRTIPGTTIRCRLEGKTLIIAGMLPPLPPIPGVKSVALFEKPYSAFERRIKFLQEIDPSEHSRDMLREHNTLIIHIKKFPKVLELSDDTF